MDSEMSLPVGQQLWTIRLERDQMRNINNILSPHTQSFGPGRSICCFVHSKYLKYQKWVKYQSESIEISNGRLTSMLREGAQCLLCHHVNINLERLGQDGPLQRTFTNCTLLHSRGGREVELGPANDEYCILQIIPEGCIFTTSQSTNYQQRSSRLAIR